MDAFTRSAVGFERFRSEWHIAAIARDAARFRTTQRDRVVAALEETGRDQLVPYLPMGMGIDVHPTLDDVAAMLDATGGNLSIPTIKQWKKLATRHLCDPWKSKVMGLSGSKL